RLGRVDRLRVVLDSRGDFHRQSFKFRHAYILSSTSPLRKAARALPRPAARRRAAQVELGHPRVVEQLAPGPLERDPPAVEDSAPLRVRQAGARILLDEEQRV